MTNEIHYLLNKENKSACGGEINIKTPAVDKMEFVTCLNCKSWILEQKDIPGVKTSHEILALEQEFRDSVRAPSHYTWHPIAECKDIIAYFPIFTGTAIKYLWRAGRKDAHIQDLRKAIQNIEFEIERLEKKNDQEGRM